MDQGNNPAPKGMHFKKNEKLFDAKLYAKVKENT